MATQGQPPAEHTQNEIAESNGRRNEPGWHQPLAASRVRLTKQGVLRTKWESSRPVRAPRSGALGSQRLRESRYTFQAYRRQYKDLGETLVYGQPLEGTSEKAIRALVDQKERSKRLYWRRRPRKWYPGPLVEDRGGSSVEDLGSGGLVPFPARCR